MRRHLATRRGADDGITLTEILIGVVVMASIIGAVAATFTTALNGTTTVSQKVRESNDAQLIAAYLTRDAQAVGGINPDTGTTDATLGISTSDADGCTGTGSLVVRFKWKDQVASGSPVTNRVSYYLNSNSLIRVQCTGTNSTVELGRYVASATTSCTPACTGIPTRVSLTVTETNNPQNAPSPYQFTLTASVRPEAKSSAPTSLNATVLPLIALGGAGTCPTLSVTGNTEVEVMGSVIVNGTNSGSCEAMRVSNNAEFDLEAPNTEVRILQGGTCDGGECPDSDEIITYSPAITDPLAGTMPVPANTCGSGSNPGLVSGHRVPGTYPTNLSVSGTVVFDPGVYVMCNGVSFASNANVSGSGVFFYLPAGTVSFSGQSNINLAAPATGSYKGVLFWQAGTTTMTISGGTSVNTYAGIIYAPNATVSVSGGSGSSIGAIVAKAVLFSGNSENALGPVPLSITGPSWLATAAYNVAYTSAGFTTKGGSGGVTWSQTGLPAGTGLTLNAATGVISGTPTLNATTTYNVVVTATDSAGATATVTRSLRVLGPPKPTSVELRNANGQSSGRPEDNDTIVVVFSEQMEVDSFCSSWNDDFDDQELDNNNQVFVNLNNNVAAFGGRDTITLTVNGACNGGFNFGAIDLGSSLFTSGNRTFGGSNSGRSTIDWDASNRTLTIRLGQLNGGSLPSSPVGNPNTATYIADTDLESSAGLNVVTTANNDRVSTTSNTNNRF